MAHAFLSLQYAPPHISGNAQQFSTYRQKSCCISTDRRSRHAQAATLSFTEVKTQFLAGQECRRLRALSRVSAFNVDVQLRPLETYCLAGPRRLMIAGAPASGKGTQCELIAEKFNVTHISTGDLLRAAVQEGTELGKIAKGFMDAGELVPDDLIISMVKERLAQVDCLTNGFLLDGFPRTKAQADALKAAGIEPEVFLLLDVPDETLVERVAGRRQDPVTGKIYHLKFSPPKTQEISDRLIQRSDDDVEKMKVRIANYHRNIDEIMDSYKSVLQRLNGNLAKDLVFTQIERALTSLLQ
eukprot:CAMPEP_0184350546 /NCGR_PEP_ID=MMETSP1089-20130417/38596_1 /TAXON_ID=38269 ORGANISM="Gloeochaete wittrockiana, Strain SAG46.84" /NCGR_SAMPLE_ID=MMETSP1089 /ASSEMBLY_ACC=CAM_ASM_000445 /LENGTH=298 /DNA_ID=CAMNT_0026683333 /DNA_START=35 /DNA_END=931 /DNA_ORIENTATION=+